MADHALLREDNAQNAHRDIPIAARSYRDIGPGRAPIDSAVPDPTVWDPADALDDSRAAVAIAIAVVIGGAIGVALALWTVG